MKLLIDADIFVYKAISSVERETEWEPDVWTVTTDLNEAHDAFKMMLDGVCAAANVDEYVMCFSDSANFRKDVYPLYKSNRSGRKPVGFKPFREAMIEQYKGIIKPTLEADDVVGILATKYPDAYIIVSGDKDLMQIPGKHLVDGSGIIEVSEEEGEYLFYTQTLTGDAVDGYPGCPGIGKVKAEKILNWPNAEKQPWQFVVEAYEKAGLTEEDALAQARCARILRYSDWNEKEQKVILWTPTS